MGAFRAHRGAVQERGHIEKNWLNEETVPRVPAGEGRRQLLLSVSGVLLSGARRMTVGAVRHAVPGAAEITVSKTET